MVLSSQWKKEMSQQLHAKYDISLSSRYDMENVWIIWYNDYFSEIQNYISIAAGLSHPEFQFSHFCTLIAIFYQL